MTQGSVQLRMYRIARRDGATREDAAERAGILLAEAKLIDADDARDPPPPKAFLPSDRRGVCRRMSLLARLLDEVEPDVAWHICPRDKLGLSEEARQQQFLRMIPFVAPALLAFAIPNAARRTRWEAAKAKREGMRAGVADVHVAWNHGSAWLEFKSGTGTVEPNQRDFLNRMTRLGHRVAVVRTADAAFRLLAEWGAPVQMRVLEGLRP